MESEIEGATKRFAKAILDSPEYREFLDAEKNLQENHGSVSLLEKLEKKQRAFSSTGDEDILKEIAELQKSIGEDKHIQRFEDAQQKLLAALAKTDSLITGKLGTKFAQKTSGGCCGC
ncbi:MAG: YlbF family regulator [Candidatus Woesearchaeota archaeon]